MAPVRKKLGLLLLMFLTLGNMVGVGIFLLPASMASIGSISVYGWILASVGALLLALVFARISTLVPKGGGPYAYAHVGFGEYIGFHTAYSYWVSVTIGNAATALGVVAYLRVFFPGLIDPIAACTLAIASLWFITCINIFGVRLSSIVQLVATIIKLLPLLLIIALGWHYFDPSFLHEPVNISGASDYQAVMMAAVLAFWGFLGLESAAVTLNVAENPRRNIPLATILATVITIGLYITLIILVMGMLPLNVLQHSTSPMADVAQLIFGTPGKWIIIVWAVVSCLGAINGWKILQSQMALAAAENHMFPRVFARLNRFDVPISGMVVAALCETIILIFTAETDLMHQFNVLVMMSTFSLMMPYFKTCLAQIFILGQVHKPKPRTWMHIAIAGLATVFSFWLIFNAGWNIIYFGAVLLISSSPLYIWMRLKK